MMLTNICISIMFHIYRGEKGKATIKRPRAVNERSFLAREGRAWRASWRRWHISWAHMGGCGWIWPQCNGEEHSRQVKVHRSRPTVSMVVWQEQGFYRGALMSGAAWLLVEEISSVDFTLQEEPLKNLVQGGAW